MYIPEEKVAEILQASDIVDVVSESVMLNKKGRNFFGLCPFHSEKTPSFSVNPGKQIFHCFGCGSGGNAISYLMKYHAITFPEAARMLARKHNITIDTAGIDPQEKAKYHLKESLYRLNRSVKDLYAGQLQNSTTAENARKYLKNRGTSDDIIQKFALGFAEDAWDFIARHLKELNVPLKTAEASGLVLPRKNSSGHYDRFRNRIIFPIFNVSMQVAGFGGRVMDDSLPKYLNSPETAVYNKSRILYGLHASKQHCRQQESVCIVEGYFDFLSLYQHGIKNVVASLGTALTREHVRLLKGYASKMVLVFDSDAAGINAAKRSIQTFMKESVDTKVLVLPEGNDPDSFVMKHGAEAFKTQLANAKGVMAFLLDVAMNTHGFSVEGRAKILDDMKTYLGGIQDSALRSMYVRELAEKLNIDEKAVLEKVKEQVLNRKNKPGLLQTAEPEQNPAKESDRREEQLISMMLNFPEIIKEVKRTDTLEYFYSDRLKTIAKRIISLDPEEEGFISNVMALMKNQEDQQLVASLAMNDVETEDQQQMKETALSILQRIIRVRTRKEDTITSKIISAEKGSGSDVMELLRQKQQQIRQLHGQ